MSFTNVRIGDSARCCEYIHAQPNHVTLHTTGKVIAISESGIIIKRLFKTYAFRFKDIREIKRNGKIVYNSYIGEIK